jgi:hypothetical protein
VPATFESLYQGLCDILQAPSIPLAETGDGPTAFHINRQGVVVNALYFAQTCAEQVFVLFEFGAIPYEDPRAFRIVLALLDVNFLLPQALPPALGRNPDTGDVVLRCVYPLADANPAGFLEMIDQGVALALEWRRDFFLGADTGDEGRSMNGPSIPVGGLA